MLTPTLGFLRISSQTPLFLKENSLVFRLWKSAWSDEKPKAFSKGTGQVTHLFLLPPGAIKITKKENEKKKGKKGKSSSQLRVASGWQREENALEEGEFIHGHLSETVIPLAEL